jgi:pyruvate dehydrogenase E2 component (dihydrolipoamide acetyltransferase)
MDIKLPELGENIESAQVTAVLVQPGDQVEKDQVIVEIETDKAVIEVPAEFAGKVEKVFVKEGEKVSIGQTLITLSGSDDSAESGQKTPKQTESTPAEKASVQSTPSSTSAETVESKNSEVNFPENTPLEKEVIMDLTIPFLGEGIEAADITQVFVQVGDRIKIDQAILEMETDKATLELPSEYNGKVVELYVKAGEKAEVGKVYMKLETLERQRMPEVPQLEEDKKEDIPVPVERTVDSNVSDPALPVERPAKSALFNMPSKIAPAAPTVRRFARQIGVNINEVPGTGPGGRISMDDVKAFSKKLHEEYREAPKGGLHVAKEPLPDFTKFGKIRVEDMSNVRRKTAEHLSYAWATIPQVTQFDKADITGLEKARKKFSAMAEKESGNKLTITAILLKVVAMALKKFPQFNSSIDMENKQVIYKDYFNIGVAVDTERGLIVPVIRDVDRKSIFELSDELAEIALKARNRKIGLDDLQGGNFTISNLGGLGGTAFTPIVNSPEVAILGVSRGGYEPRFENGEFIPRLMLPLSLSYDHRIIDGADAVRFVRYISLALEEPMMIALNN